MSEPSAGVMPGTPHSSTRRSFLHAVSGASLALAGDGRVLIPAGHDTVRTRPPLVSNVHISRVTVGEVATPAGRFSCYQPIVIVGPVAANYNGEGKPQVLPVTGVTISDCDFGTPVNAANPVYIHNVKGRVLKNVKVAGKLINRTLSA